MKVKIKKLHDDAVIPTYGSEGAAGFDFYALEDVTIKAGCTNLVKTGLSFEIPIGYELQVRPRSGMSLKTSFRVANSPGTVDSDYRGEVCIIGQNNSIVIDFGDIFIKKGDRIAQGVLCPVYQAEFELIGELSDTERGTGGFGHTGIK